MNIYEARLRSILDVVNQYLPLGGTDAKTAMGQIIALVDPWPTEPSLNPPVAQNEMERAMEMMNRAIEDASDFMEMKRKLMERLDERILEAKRDPEQEQMRKVHAMPPLPPKRPGENRRDYRARVLSAQKARA